MKKKLWAPGPGLFFEGRIRTWFFPEGRIRFFDDWIGIRSFSDPESGEMQLDRGARVKHGCATVS